MASSGNFYMYLLFGENYYDFNKFCLFVWFDALRPSQYLWSYRDGQFT